MEFLELAKKRYSCRKFDEIKIEKEVLDKILEAGRVAPTAVNFQPQRILVIESKENLAKFSECSPYGWNAPTLLVVCWDKNISWKRKFDGKDEGIVDASIVTTHMMLEIADLGLGSTWIGMFDPEKLKKVYSIPENIEPVAVLAVGYPAEDAKPSHLHEKRENINKTVFSENFK